MGKLILGILAVIVLQISFSIYLAMDRAVDETSVASIDPASQKSSVRVKDVNLAPHADAESHVVTAPGTSVDIPASPSSPRPAARTRIRSSERGFENRQTQWVSRRGYSRRSNNSYRVGDQIANAVRRQYFGGMVVETGFQVSTNRGSKFIKGKTRRLVFGNVIVEHKYAV